jgi:hypothetical protein
MRVWPHKWLLANGAYQSGTATPLHPSELRCIAHCIQFR